MMGRQAESNRGRLRDRLLKHFSKRLRGDHGHSPPKTPVANIETSTNAIDPSSPSAHENSVGVPSPEQVKQDSSQIGLWMRAANSLDPRDGEQLEKIIRSKRKCPGGREPDSLAEEVNLTLSRAEQLKMEGIESSWRPVVDKIIKGALAFKSLGEAVVAFDKSGYAALGWSVVSFALQLATNAEDAREFVLSSSEVITRFMAKYRHYERIFRGADVGEDFDRHLTNVYKAILRYTIALHEYLCQRRSERFARGAIKHDDRSIVLRKKDIDTADAEVSDWLIIISYMRHHESLAKVQRMLQNRNLPQIPDISHQLLKSLSFLGMEDRLNDIERAAEGTCKWLLRHETYKRWSDCDRGLLCIKGKPGSGKSTLLQYALGDAVVASKIHNSPLHQTSERYLGSGETIGTEAESGPLVLSFFFHDRGTELQKTTPGLFRSLLHQILRAVPDGIPDVLLNKYQDRKDNMGDPGEQWQWHWQELREFFRLSLLKVVESRPVWLFIDALDEYGKDSANELIKTLQSWIQECPSQAQFHVCVTCRHFPHLALPHDRFEICLENENKDDISTWIQNQLSAWSPSEHVATICTDITDRASGVFMWARLIIERLLDLERNGENWVRIKEEIDNSPGELEDLYKELIENVEDKRNSLKLFNWIFFAMKPLTLDELRWAMIVDPDLSHSPNSTKYYETTRDFASDCDMMEKKLKTLSCGLAETVTLVSPVTRMSCVHVQVIHQSVKDFFIREGLSTLNRSQNSAANPETDELDLEASAHYQLSRTCIRYFSLEEIMQPGHTATSGLQDVFPLLHYATEYWIAHAQQDVEAVSETDLLDYFGWPSEAIVQRLAKICGSLKNDDVNYGRRPKNGTTLLILAVRYQLKGLLRAILERKDLLGPGIDTSDTSGTPLWWAADEGHEAVVRLLLNNGAKVNAQCGTSSRALIAASQMGNTQIVQILLDAGADVDVQDGHWGTALQRASDRGHEQIVRLLLKYGADVNAPGEVLGSALIRAWIGGHPQIMEILLEWGAEGREWIAAHSYNKKNLPASMHVLLEQEADESF